MKVSKLWGEPTFKFPAQNQNRIISPLILNMFTTLTIILRKVSQITFRKRYMFRKNNPYFKKQSSSKNPSWESPKRV